MFKSMKGLIFSAVSYRCFFLFIPFWISVTGLLTSLFTCLLSNLSQWSQNTFFSERPFGENSCCYINKEGMTTEGPNPGRKIKKFSRVVGMKNIGYLIIFTNPSLWPVIIYSGDRECVVIFVSVYYWHLVCECR